ncbi:hemolysin family protein [Myxococcota bacterium]|nr:hemolysin family protein [Myxococcota bacterium]MBU1433052.1 hemolysin family protein [Myxococcota bacterium]MBU1898075.1 hemolysin family protein [Myxococcota bacterium]
MDTLLEITLTVLPWLIILLCVLSEAFFAASELSIISADRVQLDAAKRAQDARAKRALWFRERPSELFGTTLLGTNISTVTGSTIASLVLMRVDPEAGEFWAMLLMSPLILIGGELLPKSLAQGNATKLALRLSGPLYMINRLFKLPVFLIKGYTHQLYRLLNIDVDERRALISREELCMVMESEISEGEIEDDERAMIRRIFAFSHLSAKDSLIPIEVVFSIPHDATIQQAAQIITERGFSRLPVYRDRPEQIVGVLHQSDVLRAESGKAPVEEAMRAPFFVPETQEIDDLLIFLQREAALAAFVVNEFGETVGMLTLEDILEEIIGDIRDEFDDAGGLWRAASEGGWLIRAHAPIEALNEALRLDLQESDDYQTLAGLLLQSLRHIPQPGEFVDLPNGRRATIRAANERAIKEVHISDI